MDELTSLNDLLVSVHTGMQSLPDGDDLIESDSAIPSCSSSDEIEELITLSEESVSEMMERGLLILPGIRRKSSSLNPALPYDWPILQEEELIGRISRLVWTNDPHLDSLIREILLNRCCIRSFHKAIHSLTLMFWSDEEMRTGYLPRRMEACYNDFPKSKKVIRKRYKQFYQIFMKIFDIDQEDFDSCGFTKWIGDAAVTCRHRELVYNVP